MKTTKKFRERLLGGLLTLVLSAAMFVGFGSVEVQAKQVMIGFLQEGESLKPGDTIDATVYTSLVSYYSGYSQLECADQSIITIKDTYCGTKISELIVTNIDADFSGGGAYMTVEVEIVPAAGAVPVAPTTAECVHDWYVDVTTPGDAYVHAIVCVKCGVGGASEHIFANGVDGVCLDCGAEIIDSSSFAAVFDALYYAEANPDLKAVFGDNEDLLFSHFIDFGMAEGRVASAEFNVHAYRAYYPDLVAVFGDDLALYYHHYMNSGKAEGRVAR